MIDFRKDKSRRFWQIMFYVFAGTLVIETFIFIISFCLIPDSFTVLSLTQSSVKFANLPAKYLMVYFVGGLSKDFFLGVFTYHSYREWKS